MCCGSQFCRVSKLDSIRFKLFEIQDFVSCTWPHDHIYIEIDIPACLIFGEDDKITNIEGAAKMKEAIRGSELTVIKNSGHLSNMEQPDQFNSVLVDFIKRVQY